MGGAPGAAPVLRAAPTPFAARVRLTGPPGDAITIVDPAGRRLARLVLDPANGRAEWDGRDK